MAAKALGSIRIIVRLEIHNQGSTFSHLATAVGASGGDIVAVDVVQLREDSVVRDLTIGVDSREHGEHVVDAISGVPGVRVINVSDRIFLAHLGGKIEVTPRVAVKTREDLSTVYTPGVASVCTAIHQDPEKAYTLTIKKNTVAVVSDGTAVLGLGDIGPHAAMPVMEGKAMLFKQFAGVDAFPICLDTKDPEEIIAIVKALAPTFGGINLEDISSPRCFYIEERLKAELNIPVFHDDQHGTAVVVLAGLMNAARVVNKRLEDLHVVLSGVGAAGVAITKMLKVAGITNIVGVDRAGIIERGGSYPQNAGWQWYAENCNPEGRTGGMMEAITGADAFIGVSGPGVLKVEHLKAMAQDPIVFAMANPTPEIDPEVAQPYVKVLATGRSDYPNQINNLLCFPGMFRGALDCRAIQINEQMKLAAARAISSVVTDEELHEEYIIPSVFNKKVVELVAKGVADAAYETGMARRDRRKNLEAAFAMAGDD
ncbi:MAG TPA: NAD-dependent malic enzyme [Symbiobacteriaceae bacterium]|nr:NAD-dependent malic enzyme [Symbiobacteriaceae bacterium]